MPGLVRKCRAANFLPELAGGASAFTDSAGLTYLLKEVVLG